MIQMAGAAGDGGGGPYERQGASGGDGAYAEISVCGLLAPAPSPSPCQDFENTPFHLFENNTVPVYENNTFYLCQFNIFTKLSVCRHGACIYALPLYIRRMTCAV